MSEELKPCPFCGSTDLCVVQARIEEYYNVEPEISCKKCHYTIKLKELAIAINESPKTNADWWNRGIAKKWNTRPAEDALKAENERLKADNERLKKALEKIENLTFMPRNKDKVLDRTWHIARAALFTMHKVPANTPDTNDGMMKGGEDD